MKVRIFVAAFLILVSSIYAQGQIIQLFVAQTPPGNNTNTANWREVYRYQIDGTGGAATQLAGLPVGQVFDPVSAEFRTPTELLVGNHHGNVLGEGSVSRFEIDSVGNPTYLGNFTAPGMNSGTHGMGINPSTGELFAATVGNGIFRFDFVGDNPVPNGSFSSGAWNGLQISPSGKYVYGTPFGTTVHQFEINPDDSISYLDSLSPPGASRLDFFGMRLDEEIYIGDNSASLVHRYEVLEDDNLLYKGNISVPTAVDIAFSPDSQEMFVSSYHDGVYRFLYESSTDSWIQTGLIEMEWAAGIAVTPIPEPTTLSLFALGAILLRRRRA